jgi:hypothetical protein
MSIFTNKILCGNCEKVFIRKNERGKNKWICESYDLFSNCLSNIVSEDALIEFISRRLWTEDRTPENVMNLIEAKVEKIVVKDLNDFNVSIRGQEAMVWKPGHIHY